MKKRYEKRIEKTGMDSLESVWRTADADEACDAYVIPIPYYDKAPDGTFKSKHYEGGEFPDYVSVTGYNEFDFQEHRIDIDLKGL